MTLTTPVINDLIHYTLDNTDPTTNSPVYSGQAFVITNALTVKARVFVNNNEVSEITSGSYARVYAVRDLIPASWREQYFGPGFRTDPRVAADADPDRDGATSLEEYLGRTNPLDSLSVPIRVAIRLAPQLRWNSVPGKI